MTEAKRNLPASVAARLLNRAREAGDDYQTLLTRFCFERFLDRLGESGAKNRFVLKGAMLLRVWSDHPYRAMRDLDLLRLGDGSFEALRTDIEVICSVKVEPDAVVFDPAAMGIAAIRDEDEHAGTRVTLPCHCGTSGLTVGPEPGGEILTSLRPFLLPILEDLRRGKPEKGKWSPGGPWR